LARLDLRGGSAFKEGGSHVFRNISAGSYQMDIYPKPTHPPERAGSQFSLVEDRLIRTIPGENELILAVQSVDPASNRIIFQARSIPEPLPSGARVISSKLITKLAQPLGGERVDSAAFANIGSGSMALATGDVVRLVKRRATRVKPGAYYRPHTRARRLGGVVRDMARGLPIIGAIVELTRINGEDILSEKVGMTPPEVADVRTVGSGLAKRVVGTARHVQAMTNEEGRYSFHFPERLDLVVDTVTLRVTAGGHAPEGPVDVDLIGTADNELGFLMIPA